MRFRLALTLLGGLAGCGGRTDSTATVSRDCTAFEQSALDAQAAALGALDKRVQEIRIALGAACTKLASDLGAPPPTAGQDPATLTIDQVVAACDLAENAFPPKAHGSFTFSATAGFCYVDTATQLTCEATCPHAGPCDVGSVETRCADGHLHQVCDGPCSGAGGELRCEPELEPLSCEGNLRCDSACAALGQLEGECGPAGVQVLVVDDPALTELLGDDLPPIFDARKLAYRALKASSKILLAEVGDPSSCRDARGLSVSDQAKEWSKLEDSLHRLLDVFAAKLTR